MEKSQLSPFLLQSIHSTTGNNERIMLTNRFQATAAHVVSQGPFQTCLIADTRYNRMSDPAHAHSLEFERSYSQGNLIMSS
eukprot:scaffold122576_cov49-Attheya_sp.AAC.1